jgi:hypothetical protein
MRGRVHAVTATVSVLTTNEQGLTSVITRQVPTFYLQGLTSEAHAERVAKEIICPVGAENETINVNVCAVEL